MASRNCFTAVLLLKVFKFVVEIVKAMLPSKIKTIKIDFTREGFINEFLFWGLKDLDFKNMKIINSGLRKCYIKRKKSKQILVHKKALIYKNQGFFVTRYFT